MKFSAAILVLSFGAVSAFGLQPNTSAAASIRANAPFTGRNKAMVQPIGLDGKRIDAEFVSFLSFSNSPRCKMSHVRLIIDWNLSNDHGVSLECIVTAFFKALNLLIYLLDTSVVTLERGTHVFLCPFTLN